MATVLGSDLEVVQIYAPRTDRALDLSQPGAMDALRRYGATRHPADLAKIPLRGGRVPRVYGVRMVTATQHAVLQAERGPARAILACRLGVAWTRGADGAVERAPEESLGGARIATAAWVDRLQQLGAVQLIGELGEVVQRRAEIGDIEPEDLAPDAEVGGDPLDLYGPPSGLRLPR